LFTASISFSEIECKIIDTAGCFENTPEKRWQKGPAHYGDYGVRPPKLRKPYK
jgi:hypothetical protein